MKISDRPARGRAAVGARSDWELALAAHARGGVPLFVQIVQAVVADIRRGRLVAGQHLPGTRTLAARLGVHRNTVLSAYAELAAEGWIESDPARQTRVCDALPDVAAVAAKAARRSQPSARTLGFGLEPGPARSEEPRGLLLSDGTPDLRLLPRVALSRAYRRVIRGRDLGVLGYGDPRGHQRLRCALASMLVATRGLRVGAEDLIATRGSQMGLELVSRVLGAPGALIAVEALGYRPAWRALAASGAELVPVSVDAEGLVVTELEQIAERRPLRAVYVTPHHQYPTTATLSAARRLALLDLARRKRFAIIEDDYDHEFHYQGRPVLPLASADDAGVVVYLGTLSKILAPGLRLGYLVAPAAVLERCVLERQRIDRQGDLVTECAVAELLEDGELQRHVRRMRRIYQSRRDALVDALRRSLPGRLIAEPPPGGMALWARVEGVDVERWTERAAAHGLSVSSARSFAFDDQPRPFLRLGFAVRSAEETARAIEQLARLCPEPLSAGKARAAQRPEVSSRAVRQRPGPPAPLEPRSIPKRTSPSRAGRGLSGRG